MLMMSYDDCDIHDDYQSVTKFKDNLSSVDYLSNVSI